MGRRFPRWATVTTALAAATLLALPASAVAAPTATSTQDRHVRYMQWDNPAAFATGTASGVQVGEDGALRLSRDTTPAQYTDPYGDGTARTYASGSWTSPVRSIGFGATEAVASWNAKTPTGSWVQTELRGHRSSGDGWTKWYVMGRWTSGDDFAAGDIHRTSLDGQGDDDATVYTDTFHARTGKSIDGLQLRVTLYQLAGTQQSPTLSKIGVMASELPDTATVPTSQFTLGREVRLPVPEFSQDEHSGQYPEYDGGGEAWCSPTSTTMDLYYWHRQVPKKDLDWVVPTVDPQVDYAARYTYDYTYEGAGNWPFNAAYAAEFPGMDAFVTRLRSLAEAEQFIARGIPLVISVSFKASDMDGAGYSTNGHLFVISGFTANGDVIINDPATAHDATVTRVYKRSQVENAWVPHSGGIAYVIHPKDVPLPPPPAGEPNW
jgi:hypothetical protein